MTAEQEAHLDDDRRLTIIEASDLKFRPVEWLDRDQIPAAALTLLAGMGGKGKSTTAADKAARATRGQLDGRYAGEPVNVLWVGNEDGHEDVVGPRLHMAGADMTRVGFLTLDSESLGDDINIVTDIDAIRDAIHKFDAKMVVFDPVVEYLPGATDSHNDMSVRRALRPLRDLAIEVQVAAVGIVHLNKGDTLDVAARIAGSAAFRNAARSVLIAADYPEQDGWRVLFQNKSNFGPETGRGRLYRIEGVPLTDLNSQPVFDSQGKRATTSNVVWGDSVELEPGSLPTTETEREAPKRDNAKDLLATMLRDGPRLRSHIEDQAARDNISWRTIRRAKSAMGIEDRQFHEPGTGQVGPSWWGLPDTDWDRLATTCVSPDGPPVDSPRSLANQGERLSGRPRLAISSRRQRDVANQPDGHPVNGPEQTLIDGFDATTIEVFHHPNGHEPPPLADDNEHTDVAELLEHADPIDYEYQPTALPPGDDDER